MPENTVSIDRITVVGRLEISLQDLNNQLGKAWEFRNGSFEFLREDDDGNTEHLAWLEENKFKQYDWRLDFNPNHISEFERLEIAKVIQKLDNPHFSRLDIAFDVFNDPQAMNYRVYRWNVKEMMIETYKGRQKRVETIYWGSRASREQIRLYDKYVEQTAKQKGIPAGVTDWARLELQLRGKRPEDWLEATEKMLEQFKVSDFNKVDDYKIRSVLIALDLGLVNWDEMGKEARAKYRKMINDGVGFDNSLSVDLVKVLFDNLEKLQNELQFLLNEFGIHNYTNS